MAVAPGRRYGTLESYLLPKEVWESMQQRGETGLALTCSAEEYLEQQQQQIHTSLRALQQEMEHGNGLTVDANGEWHLERLTAETPRAAKVLSRQAYRLLPRIDLAHLVQEVVGWTAVLHDCPHLITGDVLSGDLAHRFLLVIMAQGMNIGLDKMAQASPYSYRQLAWVEQWFLREETLSQMLITLNNFIAQQELARLWGDGTQSSSDGLRVRLGVQSAQAAFHATHGDGERGATFYLQTLDFWSPHGHKVIKANDREALHVLDLLYYHATPFPIETHDTDTAGSTDILFGLSDLFGFRFCPRLADVLSRQFFTVGPPDDYDPLNTLIKGRVNPEPIRDYWSDTQWIAASIAAGTAPPSVILRTLHQTHPRQNRLGRALMEKGKRSRTLHQIAYVRDVVFRHSVQTALNKGEAINGLGRTLFLGQRGVLRERAYHDQMNQVSCLTVLMAMVRAWNTVYLTAAIQTLRTMGVDVSEELLSHISPTGWSHINILGQYTFESESWSLDQLRPLRTPESIDTDDHEGVDGQDD